MAQKSTTEIVTTTVIVMAFILLCLHWCGHKPTDAELEQMDHAYEQGH